MRFPLLLVVGVSVLLAGCESALLSALMVSADPLPEQSAPEPLPTVDYRGWRVADLSRLDRAPSSGPVASPPRVTSPSRTRFRIPFAAGSQQLGPRGRKAVSGAAAAMGSSRIIVLRGMTDDWGDTAFRDRLAFGRAAAVRAALESAGIPRSRIRILGRVTDEFARAVRITLEDGHAA